MATLTDTKNIDNYEILTDKGWVDISAIHKTIPYDVWIIETENYKLECADEHILFDEFYNEVFIKDITIGDYIITENGPEEVINIFETNRNEVMYDLTVKSEDHRMFTDGILSHNSTLMTIYILWSANFYDDQKVLLVANKEDTAKEIFGRVRMAYEMLPNWLKSPVKEYAKTTMELENGSRVAISTTTGSAARGQSISLLVCDEVAHIECVTKNTMIRLRNIKDGSLYNLSVDDIYHKFKLVDGYVGALDLLGFSENNYFEVYTPDGWKYFKGIAKYNKRKILKITTDSGKQISVSENHLFCNLEESFLAKSGLHREVLTIDGEELITSVKFDGFDEVYDVVDVAGCHKFYGNDILNHNTHLMDPFWASVFPIISSSKKSKAFMCSTPNGTGNLFYDIYQGAVEGKNNWAYDKILWNDVPGRTQKWADEIKKGLASEEKWQQEFEATFLNSGTGSMNEELYKRLLTRVIPPIEILMDGKYLIFEHPHPDKLYVGGVDVAEGVGGDYSVIKMMDITDLEDIKEVAEYYSNTIPVAEFTNVVHEILGHWGNPLVCIERNNQGGQVADRLGIDLNYPKIVNWGSKLAGRKSLELYGMVSSRNTKYRAVANARYYYNDKECITFKNSHSLEELFKDFVKVNDTWQASSGKHDDRTMAMIWALMVLDKELCERWFEIIELDAFGKPSKIAPLDQGIQYFENPTSIYTNENIDKIENSGLLPMSFSGSSEQTHEVADLLANGWTFLGGRGNNVEQMDYNIDFDKYF